MSNRVWSDMSNRVWPDMYMYRLHHEVEVSMLFTQPRAACTCTVAIFITDN